MYDRRLTSAVLRFADTARLPALIVAAAVLVIWLGAEKFGFNTNTGRIIGQARAIDGDTLSLNGVRVRLYGIDAPESRQTCLSGGETYPCGAEATQALADLVRTQTVRCDPMVIDRYNRIVAHCRTDAGSINAEMVRQGHAVAYYRYSLQFLPDELIARIARRGLWAGSFQMPWDFRADKHTALPRGIRPQT